MSNLRIPVYGDTNGFWPTAGCIPPEDAVSTIPLVISTDGISNTCVIRAASAPGTDVPTREELNVIRKGMGIYLGGELRTVMEWRSGDGLENVMMTIDRPFSAAAVDQAFAVVRRGVQQWCVSNTGAADALVDNTVLVPDMGLSANQETLVVNGYVPFICYDATGTTLTISVSQG